MIHSSLCLVFQPSNSKDKQIVNITRLETPLGTMFACAVEKGICLLEFSDRRMPGN